MSFEPAFIMMPYSVKSYLQWVAPINSAEL